MIGTMVMWLIENTFFGKLAVVSRIPEILSSMTIINFFGEINLAPLTKFSRSSAD